MDRRSFVAKLLALPVIGTIAAKVLAAPVEAAPIVLTEHGMFSEGTQVSMATTEYYRPPIGISPMGWTADPAIDPDVVWFVEQHMIHPKVYPDANVGIIKSHRSQKYSADE